MPSPPKPEPPPREDLAKDLQALIRLRDRVEAAAREIERLREENARLAERVQELADSGAEAAGPSAGLSLPDATDPAALRRQIEGFIEAIDHVLAERTAESGTAAASEPTG